MRRVVGVVGELLITAGLLVLLFVAWQLWWTDVEANADQSQTVTQLTQAFASPDPQVTTVTPADPAVTADAFAILRIPRFGTDYARPILEGTDADILAQGIGHYAGTAQAGEVGNFALAGHRTTWGRPLHDVELLAVGDTVLVETKTTYDVYAVRSTEIVAPTDVDVIAPVPDAPGEAPTAPWLTLTTCHPKYSAEQRYIVHAELVHAYPRADGIPPHVLTDPAWEG